ncbi:DivIVA domain-containing protein [Spirillospora sp. NPDC047279]|uniref:DivIVA domain-containing protein n=1 Tax=Spirillospora sp. NPDC047279 TaxID=3155478 RepID=UPI0033CA65B7
MSEDRPAWYALSRLTEPFKPPRSDGRPETGGRVTPEAVHNQRFTTTRLLPGYAMEEVDAFLEEVREEIERLIRERDEARARGSDRSPL